MAKYDLWMNLLKRNKKMEGLSEENVYRIWLIWLRLLKAVMENDLGDKWEVEEIGWVVEKDRSSIYLEMMDEEGIIVISCVIEEIGLLFVLEIVDERK